MIDLRSQSFLLFRLAISLFYYFLSLTELTDQLLVELLYAALYSVLCMFSDFLIVLLNA